MTTTIKLVRKDDGTISVDDTLTAAEVKLYELKDAEALNTREVSACVHEVFDQHLGKTLPMPALCAIALATLGVDPMNYVSMEKAMKDFVRTSPEFKVNKGKNGGVTRLCDQPNK